MAHEASEQQGMVAIRALRWPDDRDRMLALDTSFTTDRIYDVVRTDSSFALRDVPVSPARRKVYDLDVDALPSFDHVVVAEDKDALIGLAALTFEAWNRRAVLWHLYVAPAYRGRSVGRHLLDEAVQWAQAADARCVWLETQNVNYGAIKFYRAAGFEWCGLDTSLYDPRTTPPDEIALFFVRWLDVDA